MNVLFFGGGFILESACLSVRPSEQNATFCQSAAGGYYQVTFSDSSSCTCFGL